MFSRPRDQKKQYFRRKTNVFHRTSVYMHVVILILMLQQSQVLWPQKLNFVCWRRCIKVKFTMALRPDEAESKRTK